MNTETTHWIIMDDSSVCSAQHLVDVSGLSNEELERLIEGGAIMPVGQGAPPASFSLRYVAVASTARRLRDDFELDANGLVLALKLLGRIEEMEAQLAEARAQLGRITGTSS
jgi:chaperone modulatory protein CbpM